MNEDRTKGRVKDIAGRVKLANGPETPTLSRKVR